MLFFMLAGIASACAALFLLLKLDIQKVLYFDFAVDVAFSALMFYLFYGTFSGMMAAALGSAIFSIALYFIKQSIGYKKPVMTKQGFSWKEVKCKSYQKAL